MSYDYFDASRKGWLASGPSCCGQWALSVWVRRQSPELLTEAIRFYFEEGYSEEPRKLARDLARLPAPRDPGVAMSLRALAWTARRADEILILSDGC